MTLFFSPSTVGFYASDIHGAMPPDAVPISAEEHRALLEGQSAGQQIVADEGGRPALRDYPPVPLTEADYQRAIEAHVDAVAQGRRYSSAAACASYIASTEAVWAAEATAFVVWRDEVYRQAFAALAAVTGGEAEPPTIADFVASLPAIEWPEAPTP